MNKAASTAAKEIRQEIRETKREMKSNGVRIISCFNGGLTNAEYGYNNRLFALNNELEHAERQE